MKVKFLSFISAFIFISSVMTSCLKENDSFEYSTDATIYSFSINNIQTTIIHDKDTVRFTVDGDEYPFRIDQKNGLIYNTDSLPVNTDLSKVSLNITTAGGPVYYQKNGKDTIWSSIDSVNFSNSSFTKPITFLIYSPGLNPAPREYKVWINVHKQYPDSLEWKQLKETQFPGSAITGKQKAVILNNTIYVFAQIGSQVKMTSTGINDGITWQPLTNLNGVSGTPDCSSAIVFDNKIYITSGGTVYTSAGGNEWQPAPSPQIQTFITSFTNSPAPATRLYPEDKRLIGISGNRFIQTTDGISWSYMGDSIPDNFPANSFTSCGAYISSFNPDIERAAVIGSVPGIDSVAVSWTILSNERQFVQLSPYANSRNNCPKLNDLSLIHYDGLLYAFGGKGLYDSDIKPFQSFYSSQDNGITWTQVNRNLKFPKQFLGRENSFSYIIDGNHFIWILWSGTGEVWKGRINRLGFIKE